MSGIPKLPPPPIPTEVPEPSISEDIRMNQAPSTKIPKLASEEEVARMASKEVHETDAKVLKNEKDSIKCQENMGKIRNLRDKHQAFINKCAESHGALVLIKCNIKEKEEEQYHFLGEYRDCEGLDETEIPKCDKNVQKYQQFDDMLKDYNPIMIIRLFKDPDNTIKIYLKNFTNDAAMKEAIIPLNEAFMYENITPEAIVNYTEPTAEEEANSAVETESVEFDKGSAYADDGEQEDTDEDFEDISTDEEDTALGLANYTNRSNGGKKKKKKRRKSRTKKKKRRNSTRKIA